MTKKCMKTAIRVYFHDRNEETKETKTKYEIFFFLDRKCIWENLKTFNDSLHILYELSMVISKWKGERAGYETLHDCKTCLPGPRKVIEKDN